MACNTEPSMKRINTLEKQVSKIEKKYQETETAFDNLVADCAEFDEFLRKNNTPKPEMQLLRAYLQQYEDERIAIQEEMQYSRSQIADLKEDFNKLSVKNIKSQLEASISIEETAVAPFSVKKVVFCKSISKTAISPGFM